MKIKVTVSTGFYGAEHIVEHEIEDLGLTNEEFLSFDENEKYELFRSLEDDAIGEHITASCEVINE